MKKLRLLFSALALLLCSISISAHDFEVDGIYYNIKSSTDMTVEVTFRGDSYSSYSNEYTGSVTIPENVFFRGKSFSVTSIGYEAFRDCSGLTSVTIPNSVTSIGGQSFDCCSGLTSVTIPNSVKSIGIFAFYGCSGLTSVTIPNSVTSIGYSAFFYCSGLKGVHISDIAAWCKIDFGSSYFSNPLYYAKHLFLDGEEIKDLVIPNSVESIGCAAFSGCSGLTSVTIPNSVTSIGDYAFKSCSGLTSVTIPNSVTSIGGSAFYSCSGLTSVTIPNSVTSIGGSAFYSCSGLTSVEIPNSVTSIGEYTFHSCSGLTSVTIPNSVTSIGGSAFYSCSGLTSVTIGNSVTSIGNYAFDNCDNIGSIYIATVNPPSVESNNFDTTDYALIDLYVPKESFSAYKSHSVWGKFKFIYTYDATGIEGVEFDNELVNDTPVYNLQGMKMQNTDNLPAGIYIKGGKKYLVK